MKKQFPEYYGPSSADYDRIWDGALIVFDTNVLLDLYRYSEDVSADFISAMKFYKKRLWLPFQIAWEFQKNRISTICGQAEAYVQLCRKLEEEIGRALGNVKQWDKALYVRHPFIKLDSIEQSINRSKETIKKKLTKQSSEYPFKVDSDHIFDEITSLYDGNVGDDYDESQYKELFAQAKKRYEQKVPPGYKDENDKKEKSQRELYGDFILWKQIIDKCKSDKKDVIFVSNDEKEDWRLKLHGKTIGVRKELIREFENSTDQKILVYNSKRFLEYAKHTKELKVSQKTIKEVEKVKNDSLSWLSETTFPSLYPDTLYEAWGIPATMFPHTKPLGFAGNQDYIVPYTKQYYTPSYLDMIKETEGYVNLSDYFDNAQHQYVDIFDGLSDTSKKILSLTSKKKDK